VLPPRSRAFHFHSHKHILALTIDERLVGESILMNTDGVILIVKHWLALGMCGFFKTIILPMFYLVDNLYTGTSFTFTH